MNGRDFMSFLVQSLYFFLVVLVWGWIEAPSGKHIPLVIQLP